MKGRNLHNTIHGLFRGLARELDQPLAYIVHVRLVGVQERESTVDVRGPPRISTVLRRDGGFSG